MSKITVKQLESLSIRDVGRTIRDERNLIGKVNNTSKGISVAFYYRFRWMEKWRDYSCGSWPKHSLLDIRRNRDDALVLVNRGINPIDEKKARKIEEQAKIEKTLAQAKKNETENLNVRELFDVWLEDGVSRKDENKELIRSFEKDVLPLIGDIRIKDLTDTDLRNLLKTVKKRDVTRYLIRLHHDINQMLRWAEKRKPWRALLIDGNPAELVEPQKLIDSEYTGQRDRVLSDEEIVELAQRFEHLEHVYSAAEKGKKYEVSRPIEKKTQIALWLCLSTLCRIGELLKARWENVDLDKGIWIIPQSDSKNNVAHHIFLSDFALNQFRQLHLITGKTDFLYPSRNDITKPVSDKSISKMVGDRQIQFKNRTRLKNRVNDNALVLSNGKHGDWTPHDLRRTGATIMQSLGISLDLIDRCQNHVLSGSKVRRHYMHHDYEQEKREAWQLLGHKLEGILLPLPYSSF
ncbi:tyrosine-type recombinase/integrase [Methylophaga sp.]|uniref:tyrosine-type recombinase/integrase n=1 Tax=Methylophaga sp. TaxID=2024840 RepID=UPI003A8E2737